MLKVVPADAMFDRAIAFVTSLRRTKTCGGIAVSRHEECSKTLTVFPPSKRLANKFIDYHVRCPIVAGAQQVTALEGDPKRGYGNRSGISLTR